MRTDLFGVGLLLLATLTMSVISPSEVSNFVGDQYQEDDSVPLVKAANLSASTTSTSSKRPTPTEGFENIELQPLHAVTASTKSMSHSAATCTVERNEDEYFGGKDLEARAQLEEGEEAIIAFENIHKTYLLGIEGVPALRGVSMTVKKGEMVCIFGTSGGGKTTLLNILGTIDRPTKGQLFLSGQRINHSTPDKILANLRLNEIGFVFQTFNLLSSLTALENVEMPMILAGRLTRTERRARAISLLERVGMGNRLDHQPSQLSGGEQQRVTIARAMANDPAILLLDEPTGDLDTINSAIVMRLLMDLNAEGVTLVMVTHDVGLKYYANRIIWMRDGKIARIERVSEAKRRQTIAELDSQMEDIQQSRESGIQSNSETTSSSSTPFNGNFHNTQVRQPADYPTNANYNPARAMQMHSFMKNVDHEAESGFRQVRIVVEEDSEEHEEDAEFI